MIIPAVPLRQYNGRLHIPVVAAVQPVQLADVDLAEALPLAHDGAGVLEGGEGGETLVDGERGSSIVHDGADVVRLSASGYLVPVVLFEIHQHRPPDVICVHKHMLVAVRTALLVPEAERVHELVHDDAGTDAAGAQRELLAAAPAALHAANTTVATFFLHHVHVVVRGVSGCDRSHLQTGVPLKLHHSASDHGALATRELPRHGVVEDAVWPQLVRCNRVAVLADGHEVARRDDDVPLEVCFAVEWVLRSER